MLIKLGYFILAIIILAACSSYDDKKIAVDYDSIIKKEVTKLTEDSLFVIGDFLFEGPKNMKFEFVKRGEQSKNQTKGDTLYEDKDILILGSWKALTSPGIFKKFKFKSQFQDFKVANFFDGKLANPNFLTDPNAKHFITRIKDGCKSLGVNFAGHYTIVEWGCGALCQEMAIVDRINGDIIFSKIPFDTADGHCGLDYKMDSRMLIVNTEALSQYNGYKEGYKRDFWRKPAVYELKNCELRRVE